MLHPRASRDNYLAKFQTLFYMVKIVTCRTGRADPWHQQKAYPKERLVATKQSCHLYLGCGDNPPSLGHCSDNKS